MVELDAMSMILTPAVTLMSTEASCPSDHSECQILGTRVCVDDINACDGVPNCGADDIYDEDRFFCGLESDFQYIFLTALTFIGVILVVFYTVHYWLRRCVPRVSEAFFIYTETTENTLYLESIMRSPTDKDITSSNTQLLDHYFESGFGGDNIVTKKTNVFHRILRQCCRQLLCRKKQKEVDEVPSYETAETLYEPKKLYSFTKLELFKMTTNKMFKEEVTQTGNSLEMNIIDDKKKSNQKFDEIELQETQCSNSLLSQEEVTGIKYKDSDTNRHYVSELELIKLTNDNKPSYSKRRPAIVHDDEREIKSTIYEKQNIVTPKFKYNQPKKPHELKNKNLRFDEEPTMIPSEEDSTDSKNTIVKLETPSYSKRPWSSRFSDQSYSRWGLPKGKKSKKAVKMPLH